MTPAERKRLKQAERNVARTASENRGELASAARLLRDPSAYRKATDGDREWCADGLQELVDALDDWRRISKEVAGR